MGKRNMSDYPPNGLAASIKVLPEWIQLGCGGDEHVCAEKGASFTAGNMPATCPDLSKHSSFFADVMKANPGHCIKTGVDNPGHPMIKTVGAVAGDEESYELFREFFDPCISARHGGYAADAKHPTDMNVRKLSTTKIDPTGKYVLTTRCHTGRSVRNLFQEPDSTLLLSSGCGRHWPDARGIFHN